MIEISNPEEFIIGEINDKRFKQEDIAKTYRIIMQQGAGVDWGKINKAIVNRWSRSGLERVKQMAWEVTK